MTTPINHDFLSGLNFDFKLDKLPTVEFFVTKVKLPGLQLQNVPVATPFKPIYLPADKIQYGLMSVTFKVDAVLKGWIEILTWMVQIGFPQSFDQRAAITPNGKIRPLYSDGSVVIRDYHRNPIIDFSFKDMLPSGLSGIEFDTTVPDVQYQFATVDFNFRDLEVKVL